MNVTQGRMKELDGLRAISVVAILLFHFDVPHAEGGFVGVDVFFVLSGFLITGNIVGELSSGSFSLRRFYYRRIRRLMPAAFVTIVTTLCVASLLFAPLHLDRLGRSALYATVSASNFFFLDEAGYFDTSSRFKPLLHFWSLAVEEQFYIVWPALLLLATRMSGRTAVPLIALGVVGIVSLALAEFWLAQGSAAAFYMMPARAFEFALGAVCVAFVGPCRNVTARIGSWAAAVGLATVIASMLLFGATTRFPGATALLPCMGTAALVLFGRHGPVGRLLRWRPALWLGTVSYSVYLVHWPIYVFVSYWSVGPTNPARVAFLMVSSLGLGALLYDRVERRFRLPSAGMISHARAGDPSRHVGVFRRGADLGTVLLAVASATFSLAIIVGDGWHWRLPTTEAAQEGVDPCPSSIRDAGRLDELCRLRASGENRASTPKVLVIGDSHAAALAPGLAELVESRGWQVDLWSLAGCPPLIGTFKLYGVDEAGKQDACRALVPRWMAAIEQGDHDVVMLVARWAWLFEPREYAGTLVRRDYLVDAEHPVADVTEAYRLFGERVRQTLSLIHGSGAAAVIVSQPPLLARDVQHCDQVPRVLFSADRRNARCESGVRRDEALERLSRVDALFTSLSSTETAAVIPSKLFCGEGAMSCMTVDGDNLLYADDNHLSPSGAKVVLRLIEPLMTELLTHRDADAPSRTQDDSSAGL